MRRGPWGSALRARLPFRTAHPSQGPKAPEAGGAHAAVPRSGPRARRGARRPRALQAAWATELRPQGRAHLPLRGATSGRFRAAPTVLPAADSGPRGGDPQPPNCGLPLPRDSVVAEAGPSLKGTRNGSKRDWKMSFYKKRCILENSFPLTYVKTNCVKIKKPYCPKGQSPGSGREQQRSGLRGPSPGPPAPTAASPRTGSAVPEPRRASWPVGAAPPGGRAPLRFPPASVPATGGGRSRQERGKGPRWPGVRN